MARSRIEIAGDALEHQSDADLAVRAANGDREAFEELYRRHSRTAMRVAYRVTGNIHDAGDAVSDAFARVMQALPAGRLAEPTRFRSYLLTSTRHAAVDVLRRAGRAVPREDGAEPAQTTAGPSELLIDRADNALVAAAFRALPERWRSVLWLTEVEGIPAREAAGMLGVSPNGVAQLAVRARAGLRERYLQAHLPEVDGDCRETVQRLGAYVGGALAPRDIARVDQHLADCDHCRQRREDLEQIGTTLRKAAVPVPVFLGGGGLLAKVWHAVNSLVHGGGSTAPVGAAAAAVFVASVAGVGVVQDRQADAATPQQAPVAAAPLKAVKPGTPLVQSTEAAASVAPTTTTTVAVAARPGRSGWRTAPGKTESAAPVVATTTTTTASNRPAPTTTTTAPPASHTDEEPEAEVPEVEVPVVEVPDVPVVELPEVPDLPLVDEVVDVVGPLPSDLVALQALAASDFGFDFFSTLWLAALDEPLPSPEAPGMPV